MCCNGEQYREQYVFTFDKICRKKKSELRNIVYASIEVTQFYNYKFTTSHCVWQPSYRADTYLLMHMAGVLFYEFCKACVVWAQFTDAVEDTGLTGMKEGQVLGHLWVKQCGLHMRIFVFLIYKVYYCDAQNNRNTCSNYRM